MKKDENGALFIEAVAILPLFMIVMVSLISLISLYTIHSKMQYAITQTANEVAAYSYFYSYLGIKDFNEEVQNANAKNMQPTDEAVGSILAISDSCTDVMNRIGAEFSDGQSGGDVSESVGDDITAIMDDISSIKDNAAVVDGYIDSIAEDPKVLLKCIVGYASNSAIEEIKTFVAYAAYPALTYKYLGYGKKDKNGARVYNNKEELLNVMGIENLDFSNSSLMPQISSTDDSKQLQTLNNRVIDVVVTYDYTLPFSILPKEASTFHIVQRSVALSWGDGDNSHDD